MPTRKSTELKDKNMTRQHLQSVGIAVEEILLPCIFTLKKKKNKNLENK